MVIAPAQQCDAVSGSCPLCEKHVGYRITDHRHLLRLETFLGAEREERLGMWFFLVMAVSGTDEVDVPVYAHQGKEQSGRRGIVVGDDADGIPVFLESVEQLLLYGEIHIPEFFAEQDFTVVYASLICFERFEGVYAVPEAIGEETAENSYRTVGEHQTLGQTISLFVDTHQIQHGLLGTMLCLLAHGRKSAVDSFLQHFFPDLGIIKKCTILVENDSLEFLCLLCHVGVSYGTPSISG